MEKTFNLETELTINSVSTTLKAMLWPLVTNTEIVPFRKITTWLDSFKLNIFLEKKTKQKKEKFNFQRPTNRKMFSQSSFPGFFLQRNWFFLNNVFFT